MILFFHWKAARQSCYWYKTYHLYNNITYWYFVNNSYLRKIIFNIFFSDYYLLGRMKPNPGPKTQKKRLWSVASTTGGKYVSVKGKISKFTWSERGRKGRGDGGGRSLSTSHLMQSCSQKLCSEIKNSCSTKPWYVQFTWPLNISIIYTTLCENTPLPLSKLGWTGILKAGIDKV